MRIYSATVVSQEPVGNLPNLFAVADGMGGHNAGDYASAHAVQTLVSQIQADADFNPIKVIRHAIEAANTEIIDQAQRDEGLRGMGTTMVVATIVGNYAYVANVVKRYRKALDEGADERAVSGICSGAKSGARGKR